MVHHVIESEITLTGYLITIDLCLEDLENYSQYCLAQNRHHGIAVALLIQSLRVTG